MQSTHQMQQQQTPQQLGYIYKQVSDIALVHAMCEPLSQLQAYTKTELDVIGQRQGSRSGKYKKRIRIIVEVKNLSLLHVPTKSGIIAELGQTFDVVLLYQQQAQPHTFDFFIACSGYCLTKVYDLAVRQFISNIAAGQANIRSIEVCSNRASFAIRTIRQQMLMMTGYQLGHQLLDVVIDDGTTEKNRAMSITGDGGGVLAQSDILVVGGKIFDVQEFGRGCIKVLENLVLFSTNDVIRTLQLETNPHTQFAMLRLLNHQPIVQELWKETISFVLTRPNAASYASKFTNEQIAVLYTSNKQQVIDAFNRYVLGGKTQIVQPHTVRALLDHIPFLQACNAFDVSRYDYRQYGLNWLLTSYYVGKNFMTDDDNMVGTQGCVCFSGAPGSGKSRSCAVLHKFMNGFSYQDTPKGITEFQNHDIVSKSFIRSEEVDLKRLMSSDWKLLSDVEVAQKYRVKNQQDLEIGKFVPVVITTNNSVHTEIISHLAEDANYGAVHRRWGYIRYFESWANAHTELFDGHSNIMPVFTDVYNHQSVNHEIMNALIACALTFTHQAFVITDYNVPYYTHCLIKFSETLFGQMVLVHDDFFKRQCKTITSAYRNETDKECYAVQIKLAHAYTVMCTAYVKKLLAVDLAEYNDILTDSNDAFYYRCLLLTREPCIQQRLKEQSAGILNAFIMRNQGLPIYRHIRQCLDIHQPCEQPPAGMQTHMDDFEMNVPADDTFDIAEFMIRKGTQCGDMCDTDIHGEDVSASNIFQ